ncbi:hypothetical protein SAV31267_037970 [Streptomyces avermitilis]|uniref:HMA domain-containing protein n=1 Tax=Streptomyces avermitilis TaxID=33903 RepID=A0A4D4MQ74_STRAX|nr:hypothetical protein SAV31267_037970 [Streptomyces avermitilis]
MSSTTAEAPIGPASQVELTIGGMTCASCAARVEKKLNRMDGVTATVNFATEKARVSYPAEVEVADLIATVVKTGYTATEPPPPRPEAPEEPQPSRASEEDPELTSLRGRLTVSVLLALPVVLLSMIPALQFDNWQWLSLTLAAPVVVWGALPFHQAAFTNARHGAATMDTLVSVGTLAAFGWSVWALFWGTPGCRACATASTSPSPAGTARPRSTWRSPPVSSRSSSSAAIWRPAPSDARVRPCTPSWSWARRTSPSYGTVVRYAFR